MERIARVFDNLSKSPSKLVGAILMVIVFTLMYYYMFKFLKENGGIILAITFIVTLIAVGVTAILLPYNVIKYLFGFLPVVFLVVTICLFSVELKRIIWQNSRLSLENKHGEKNYDEAQVNNCIDEIIKAVQNMSKNDVGAIIVLANSNMPERILESGVKLDSSITAQLIESVFFPKTPLHDGAMIINGTRITAAGCFLPLSQKENLPKELGTRHRAGIGITETIDVTTIIVSEETGIISIVKAGNIMRYADTETLRKTLGKFYWQ